MNSRRLPTDSAMRTHNADVWVTTADGCVHTDDTTKLSPTSCEFVYTPPTRQDSTVSSRRRRRCVLGFKRRLKLFTADSVLEMRWQRVPDLWCHDMETARTITHSPSTWHNHVIVVSGAKPGAKGNGDDRCTDVTVIRW